MSTVEKVDGRWPRGTVLRCPTCKNTTTTALPVTEVRCIGGRPAKHTSVVMVP